MAAARPRLASVSTTEATAAEDEFPLPLLASEPLASTEYTAAHIAAAAAPPPPSDSAEAVPEEDEGSPAALSTSVGAGPGPSRQAVLGAAVQGSSPSPLWSHSTTFQSTRGTAEEEEEG